MIGQGVTGAPAGAPPWTARACLAETPEGWYLTTYEEAFGRKEVSAGLLGEREFTSFGAYNKKLLEKLLATLGLAGYPTTRSKERLELWGLLTTKLPGVDQMPRKSPAAVRAEARTAARIMPDKFKPEAKAARAVKVGRTRVNQRTPLECTIHLTELKPQRKGEAAKKRFALYKEGMTVEAYIKKGGLAWDIWYDTLLGYVTLTNPDGTPFERKNHAA